MSRVLVVEDDQHIRELVCLHLGLEGYTCTQAEDGQQAVQLVSAEPFDLVVLDLMLPRLDGLTVCKTIRHGGINQDVPILMLTARQEESDKVVGLESGADDYLTKPFGVRELVARARALLRRPRASQRASGASSAGVGDGEDQRPLLVHGIAVDPARLKVSVRGHDVDLTSQEFRLLYVLASHPGIVFSREALLGRVWKGDTFVTVRSVDTLVKRLRRRIEEDPANPSLVLTVWGAGYKLADV